MKKLLSAIWAKALAFLLTPLAGVAAVNGVSELIMVYFYDVWNPHPVRLWVVTVLCAVVAVGSLLFSLSAAGHWPGHEGVHLTWLDRIPLDVFVLALAGEWLIYENASYYPSSVLGEVVFVALAYLFILAFTARCKAGMVLADLVVLRLLRLLSRGAVWAWRHLRVLVLSLPLTWKTAAVLVALMAAELLMLAYDLHRRRTVRRAVHEDDAGLWRPGHRRVSAGEPPGGGGPAGQGAGGLHLPCRLSGGDGPGRHRAEHHPQNGHY